MTDLPTYWTYCGDVDPAHGGVFYRLDPADLRYGYCEAVRVTDLDSGIGFRGAVLIERITVNGFDSHTRWRDAFRCCGWTSNDLIGVSKCQRAQMVADALVAYGHYDLEDGFGGPHSETLQLDTADWGPMEHDGWKADRRQTKGDLYGYIVAKWLD